MFRHLRFEVLGPVRGFAGDAELRLGSPQQRGVLAMLLLARGRQVPLDGLIDGLWGDDVPRAATGTVRTYVSRLRRRLGEASGGGNLIESIGEGYALRADATTLDLDQFEEGLTRARTEVDWDNTTYAARVLTDALGLWRGVPLAGIPGPYAAVRRVRLEEMHATAGEERLAMDIALGRHGPAIAELRELMAHHPFRERLSELMMLALYRAGRQTEALAVFDDVRRRLDTELGIEPGPALQALQLGVLRADDRLMDPALAPVELVGALCG